MADPDEVDVTYDFVNSRGKILLSFTTIADRNSGWLQENQAVVPPKPPIQLRGWTNRATKIDIEHSQFGSTEWSHLGFSLGSEAYRGAHVSSDLQYMILPHWALALPSALATIAIFRRRLRRKRRIGLCHFCGYDLRATPNLCPECGGVPATKPAGDWIGGAE